MARCAAGRDVVVLATLGVEAGLLAALVKARSRSTRVFVLDLLAPRRQPPRWLARRVFGGVDRFLVIRTGDVDMLARRFGVARERCEFLPWAVRCDRAPGPGGAAAGGGDAAGGGEAGNGGYVYAAGWAHRDWPTLIAALDASGLEAKLAAGGELDIPAGAAGRIRQVAMPPPEEGRRLAAGAALVAVVMEDTDLPSGPLVLLDAMAAGKAVVVTAVNGTRDYVCDGVTALVVPPHDVGALATALGRLASDAALRERLGRAAREEVLRLWTVERFWERLAAACG